MRPIYIVSDATGDTAEKVVRAVLAQFGPGLAAISIFAPVREPDEIEEIVRQAADREAMVLHTTVNPAHRELLARLCAASNVENIDLIGSLMARLALFLGATPKGVPGSRPALDADYFRRLEAVDFAVKNDDGQHPHNLARADIVLVGLSRSSKTPLSTYLAQRGYKCANVPIVQGVALPAELARVDDDRIYGLQIAPEALFRIRQSRLRQLGMPADTLYGMQDHIRRESDYARQIFEAHPRWPVLDVTDKAIEETAATLLAIRAQRERQKRPSAEPDPGRPPPAEPS